MERLRGFPRRFRFPWRSLAQIRRDVDDELGFHITEKIEALERQGLTADEAREEALRQFGDVEAARARLVAEDRRGERRSTRLMMLDDLLRDVRLASRSLRRTPGFTVVAVIVLALGIGVVSGAASLVNVIALKPVMMDEPEDVLGVFAMREEGRGWRAFSYAEYVEIRERAQAFSRVAAFDIAETGVDAGGLARRGTTSFVSANYFETFGVPLAQGRAFTPAEERGEDSSVAVVSYDFWRRSGSDREVLGSTVRVNGVPMVVVGVAPYGFTGSTALIATDVWVPLAARERVRVVEGGTASSLRDPRSRALMLLGRLAQGVAPAEADTELAALAATSEANLADPNGDRYTYVVGKLGRLSYGTAPGADDGLTAELLLPAAMSGVVLLIACLNLANMFLARGASRRTEMAIRQSLGSGRARLLRQFLTEGVLLATFGGIGGLVLSYWATSWIAASAAEAVPLGLTFFVDTRPDLRVLLATGAACVMATLLFGLAPAWRVTGADVLTGLKEGAGGIRLGRRIMRAPPWGRSTLMVGQIALSLAMLAVGGLFVRSALFAADALPRFSLDRTLVVELDTGLVGLDEPRSRALHGRILERLRSLPEVDAAGMTTLVPFGGIISMSTVQPAGAPESSHATIYASISDGYFDALGLPILRGRDFTVGEVLGNGGPRVAIVDEPLAARLFPSSDALGRQLRMRSSSGGGDPIVMEIVGIAPGTPGDDFDPTPTSHLYLPFGQAFAPSMNILVGVDEAITNPASLLETIREEIRAIDPALPVLTLKTMREIRDGNWSMWLVRIAGQVFTLLGALALFVAMVGLYGMKAFLISRRTHEIGIRMALGATRRAVLGQMMRESARVTAAGLAVGLVLAVALGRILASFLYQVSATDPWALLGATAFLAIGAAVAAWLPVRKALRIEPCAALRYE